MKRKLLATLLAVAMTATLLAGCTQKTTPTESTKTPAATTQASQAATTKATESAGPVTFKVFSNLPDRKTGQGLVEQTMIDNYTKENTNVKITVEALDDAAYKTKFKAYSIEGMPDVVSIWGQPSFLDEVLAAGVLAPLNEADYKDYGFISGSLDGFKKDGVLYGLPRNSDMESFYYNAKMFEDNGWKVPATYDELLALADTINAKGIAPVAMAGGDGWPLVGYLSDIMVKMNGPFSDIVTNAITKGDFSDPLFKQATDLLAASAKADLFQAGYDTQDYATAKNLFINGQAAMFYMGSWEASMALDTTIDEAIRTNIKAFTMPAVADGKGSTSILAWNGGGYAVSASSEVKAEATKFLNYMFKPENLSKIGWENGVGMSAQDETAFMTGKETDLQKQFLDFLKNASNTSGTPVNDCGTATFKTSIESEIQSVCNGTVTTDKFLAAIGAACK